jgi:hypothetical protein
MAIGLLGAAAIGAGGAALGGLGGLLGGSKGGDIEAVPFNEYQVAGANRIRRLMREGTPDLPTQQVAGLSQLEQAGLGTLGQINAGAAFQDPTTSALYASLREQSRRDEAQGVNDIRNRAQLSGMFDSSPGMGAEGNYRAQMANNRQSMLAQMFEQERARDNPYTRLAATMQYGQLPRQLEQAQMTADYQSQLQQALFPYEYTAPLAQSLMGFQQQTYQTPVQANSASRMMAGAGMGLSAAGSVMGGLGQYNANNAMANYYNGQAAMPAARPNETWMGIGRQ